MTFASIMAVLPWVLSMIGFVVTVKNHFFAECNGKRYAVVIPEPRPSKEASIAS